MGDAFPLLADNLSLSDGEFVVRLAVAIGVGFVIGLEREHASQTSEKKVFAGVRTFVLVSLLGFFSTFLTLHLGSNFLVIAGFLSVAIITSFSYWITAKKGEIGGTSEFVTLLVFFLGAAAFLGFLEISLACMVVILIFLSTKIELHRAIGLISQEELYAFVRFVTLTLLIFPFLPNNNYGPYQVINPREIGLVIVLTSGLGFAGYLAMKFLGSQKGILLTGLVGGLVSSTVVTWVFSKKSKSVPQLSLNCAIAIIIASTLMIVRVFIWIYLFNPSLLPNLVLPLSLLLASGLGVVAYFYVAQKPLGKNTTEIPLGKPLNIRGALYFGLLFVAILLFVSYANDTFGTKGILFSSGFSAFTDIDAATISISKLAHETLPIISAQNAILVATVSNTLVKMIIAIVFGSKLLRRYIFVGYGFVFLAAFVGFLIIN